MTSSDSSQSNSGDASQVDADTPGPESVEAIALHACWRCRLSFDDRLPVCPHCQAARRDVPPGVSRPGESSPANLTHHASIRPLKISLLAYCAMLATGVLLGIYIHGHVAARGEPPSDDSLVAAVAIVEFIDTLILVGVLLLVGRVAGFSPRPSTRLATWILGIVVLPLVLFIDFGYHRLVVDLLGLTQIDDPLMQTFNVLTIIMVCVQPAVVEECFFRYVILGSLNRVLGKHLVIWLVALMFAMLHIAAPLSIPYLLMLGAVLGYLRVYSGGMWLPILFHFFHNLVVLWVESAV